MEETIPFHLDLPSPLGPRPLRTQEQRAAYMHPPRVVGGGSANKDIFGLIGERIVSMLNLLKLIIYYGYVREAFYSE